MMILSLIVATQTDVTISRVSMTMELIDKLMLSEATLKNDPNLLKLYTGMIFLYRRQNFSFYIFILFFCVFLGISNLHLLKHFLICVIYLVELSCLSLI